MSVNFSLAVLDAAALFTASIISAAVVVAIAIVDFDASSNVVDDNDDIAPPRVLAMSEERLRCLLLVLGVIDVASPKGCSTRGLLFPPRNTNEGLRC